MNKSKIMFVYRGKNGIKIKSKKPLDNKDLILISKDNKMVIRNGKMKNKNIIKK